MARQRRPSAVRVNVTPVPPLTTLRPPSSSAEADAPVTEGDGAAGPDPPLERMAAETREAVAMVPPPAVGITVGTAAGAEDSAAVAAGVEPLGLDGVADDVGLTDAVVGVDGGVVVLVCGVALAGVPVAGTVVEVRATYADSGAFEPPVPTEGTVVLGAGAGATVVLGGEAAVVGGVAGATVVTGAAAVPWDWVPAGAEAGAVSAEAGLACSTRKSSPARSAKAAAHLRGLTASILGLLLIGLFRPPWETAGAAP